MALTVNPKRPASPSVVTIETPVAAAPIAAMKLAVVSARCSVACIAISIV
jgi:hypothetical protein